MSEQTIYETEVVLRVRLKHWTTTSPVQIVETAKQCLTQHPMTVLCEQVGELETTPTWPWKQGSGKKE